jgi:hypothetical protein
MKLKKVTALLLATSMVVSSVSVAAFADELVFEDEIVTVEDNAGDDVSFDDVTFEDVAEDDADYSEDVFEDEVVEDDVAVDEAFYTEDVVVEELSAEDQADPNADVYAALADAEDVVTEDVVDGQTVAEDVVDGQTVTAETDLADAVPVTATLKEKEYQFSDEDVDLGNPTFNYTGVDIYDTVVFDGTWGDATLTSEKGVEYHQAPWTLPGGAYTVTFDESKFAVSSWSGKTYAITAPEVKVTVAKAVLYADVNDYLPSIEYGADDPTSTYNWDDVFLYKEDTLENEYDFPIDGEIFTDDSVFKTDYKKGDVVGKYGVNYVKGLSSEYHEVIPSTKGGGQFEVTKAEVSVVPASVSVEYGVAQPELTFTLIDTNRGSGSAKYLESEIAAKKVTVSVYVTNYTNGGVKDKVTQFDPGMYNYSCEFDGTSKDNYNIWVDTLERHTYNVKNIPITFADYEGVFDGKYHGIIVTPDPSTLPSGVHIYYSEDVNAEPEHIWEWYKDEPVQRLNPGKTVVYYFVEQGDVQTDHGSKTITILNGGDADKKAAKAVEEQIDALPAAADATAATKPAADAAKAAYDALTDAQKALVPAEKVQKLNDVKAAADKAAEEKEKEAEKEAELFNEEVALVKEAKSGAEGKAAAEAAKEAYENLSPEAKAKLTDDQIAAYEATQEAFRETKEFVAGSNKTATRATYRVLSNGEVTYQAPVETTDTWYVVPNQIKHNGFLYRVVKVSITAFNGCENTTKIVVGKYVQSIGKYAFKNTKAMKTLKIKTSKLTAGKVTNAFVSSGKSGGAKLTVVTPSGMASAYESLFKGEGGMNASATFTK